MSDKPITLSPEQAAEVRAVLRAFIEALHQAGKTIYSEKKDGSGSYGWTATDDFMRMYLRVTHLLSGEADPAIEAISKEYLDHYRTGGTNPP